MQNTKLIDSPKIVFFCILTLGIALFTYSLTVPKFTDENKYQELNKKYYQEIITKDIYYHDITKITTNKIYIMDLSSGIIIFSLFCLVFLIVLKIHKWKDFENLQTCNKRGIFVLSNIAWLLMIFGTFFYYFYRSRRGDYPPFADSISIPVMQQTFFYLLLLVLLNLFLLFTLRKSKLSTKLLFRPQRYKKTQILWELVLLFFFIVNVVFLFLFMIDGDHISIMVSMCFMYVLLSLRAGKLNYYDNKLVNSLHCKPLDSP